MNDTSIQRKPATQLFFVADCENVSAVELKRFSGRASDGGYSRDVDAIPAKMVTPKIASRIENSAVSSRGRIRHGQSRRLSQGACDTRQGEIVHFGRTTCGLRNDVINVEGCFLGQLRQPAVFAAVFGAADNRLAHKFWSRHAIKRPVCSNARNVNATARENHSCEPSLRLHGVRCPSKVDLNLVCRAVRAAGVRHLRGVASGSSLPAFQLPVGWSVTYMRLSFLGRNLPADGGFSKF